MNLFDMQGELFPPIEFFLIQSSEDSNSNILFKIKVYHTQTKFECSMVVCYIFLDQVV